MNYLKKPVVSSRAGDKLAQSILEFCIIEKILQTEIFHLLGEWQRAIGLRFVCVFIFDRTPIPVV